MKTILQKYRLPWLLIFLLISGLIFLNFNKQENRNAPSANAISKSDSLDVSSSPFQLFNLNNDLSTIREQISALIDMNPEASGKDTTDTSDISNKNKPVYSTVGPNNEYKQLKANSLFNNQAVTQIGNSNYAEHFIFNTSFSDLAIHSIGNQNTAVQDILNGYNNSLRITQIGSLNEVYQDISSENTLGSLTNIDNITSVLQTGHSNWIKSSQRTGQNNSISTIQNGDSNRVSIQQNGNNNDTTIRQSGNKNTVKINQN